MQFVATVFALLLSFLTAVHLFGAQANAADSDNRPAIAFAAKVAGDQSRTRIIVDFDQKIRHKSYLLAEPNRLIIDLPETVFELGGEGLVQSSSLVTDLRVGKIAQGLSRIILSLRDTATIEKQSFQQITGSENYRLIVDVVHAAPDKFHAAVKKQSKTNGLSTLDNASSRKYKIVIDAGHGGIDGGAVGKSRTVEKDITLEFALKLQRALEKNQAFQVILTRDDDSFLSLKKRVNIARENNADLMISIHADSMRQHRIRGATVYTLSERGSDEISRALARKQNRADLIAGLKLPELETNVADILIDLTRRETAVFSNRFANKLVQNLQKDVQLIRNPHRSADFFVLKAPEIPSVLLELGYLSNSRDEKLMRSKKWQSKAVERTKQAIEAFFEPRLAKQ